MASSADIDTLRQGLGRHEPWWQKDQVWPWSLYLVSFKDVQTWLHAMWDFTSLFSQSLHAPSSAGAFCQLCSIPITLWRPSLSCARTDALGISPPNEHSWPPHCASSALFLVHLSHAVWFPPAQEAQLWNRLPVSGRWWRFEVSHTGVFIPGKLARGTTQDFSTQIAGC